MLLVSSVALMTWFFQPVAIDDTDRLGFLILKSCWKMMFSYCLCEPPRDKLLFYILASTLLSPCSISTC